MARTVTAKPTSRIDTISFGKLQWVNIEKPTEQETGYLAEHYPFHKLELDDCLSRIQRPKIDRDETDNYIFMVFHFPVFNKQTRITTASQVSAFLGEDYLITLHEGNLKPLTAFYRDCSTNEETQKDTMAHGPGYLIYIILDRLVNYCFPIINKIGTNIDSVEEKVFTDQAREAVREISMLRRDVLSYKRMIKPQTEVFEWLEGSELPIIKEDADVYFGDLADHNHKLMDSLDEYKEVLEGLNDTNNTLTSFGISQVMRLLTVISVILLPLSLVASLLGMNVYPMPLDDPIAIIAILASMLIIVIGMLTFFRSKRWI
ncbi:MAG: magnesium transporter CorA family protein [Chloroflexota bacterium]|nr:magnesium transporter CorA family protein [Chloroflexota bacterium]